MSSMVFYRLRQAAMDLFGAARHTVTPTSRTRDLLPPTDLRHNWRALGDRLGWAMPRLPLWRARVPEECETVGGLVRALIWHNCRAIRETNPTWSFWPAEVWRTLVDIIAEEGVIPAREMITPEATWSDLRLD